MPSPSDDYWTEAEDGAVKLDQAGGLGPIFTAEYEGDCSSCSDPIVPGEDARSDGAGAWIHADDDCERIANPRPTRKAREVPCPRCFTIHAGECI